jgi:hypothetical protein
MEDVSKEESKVELSHTLNVVAKDFPMAFGSTFAKSLEKKQKSATMK